MLSERAVPGRCCRTRWSLPICRMVPHMSLRVRTQRPARIMQADVTATGACQLRHVASPAAPVGPFWDQTLIFSKINVLSELVIGA